MSSPVGEHLKRWRERRGVSQMTLAHEADISPRHLSFVETGRSRPSRAVVMRLGEALDLPLRDRNALLSAAGFSPAFRESPLEGPALAPVMRAVHFMLDAHEPYPAYLLDACWNMLRVNNASQILLSLLLPAGSPPPVSPPNALRLLFSPDGVRHRTRHWSTAARVLLDRMRRQVAVPDPDPDQVALLEELRGYPGVAELEAARSPVPEQDLVIPLVFEVDGEATSWFTTIATLGTPQDVTLQELRIESLFPADAATERFARERLAGC